MIEYGLMNDEEREIICGWRYEGDFGIYDMPPYEEQKKGRFALGNPERVKNYYSYYDGDVLVGFTNILEEEKEVFIEIGVNPGLCGKGYGRQILLLAADISQGLYPGKPLYLEVRTWNQRAVSCYKRAGFEIDGKPFEQSTSIGKGQFYRMVKNHVG